MHDVLRWITAKPQRHGLDQIGAAAITAVLQLAVQAFNLPPGQSSAEFGGVASIAPGDQAVEEFGERQRIATSASRLAPMP